MDAELVDENPKRESNNGKEIEMVKSEIVEKEVSEKDSYPKLMKFKHRTGVNDGPFVVLFTSYGAGVVLWTENKERPIGEYSLSFAMSEFEPFIGTINLSND